MNVPRVARHPAEVDVSIGGAVRSGLGGWLSCDFVRGGYSVYPFDAPSLPMLVEIHPPLLTGPVRKTSAPDRAEYLQRCYPAVRGELLKAAVGSENAFDAAVSALVMEAHIGDLQSLRPAANVAEHLEGRIWHPDF